MCEEGGVSVAYSCIVLPKTGTRELREFISVHVRIPVITKATPDAEITTRVLDGRSARVAFCENPGSTREYKNKNGAL